MKQAVLAILGLLLLLASPIMAEKFGVGVAVGPLIPIVQEDQESGMVYAIKIRASLYGPLYFEPALQFGHFGDVTIGGIGSRVGSDLKSYGLDITLGGGNGKVGPKPYAFIGGGVYNMKREYENATNKNGWSFGSGIAVGLMQRLDIDLRGRLNIVSSVEGATRKSVGITAGAVYYFGREKE